MYFENIIGQKFAKRYMINSIKKNKISHAYMFEGINGIGKTIFCKELVKILMKTEYIENNPDFLILKPEGASIKISQIRSLQSDIIIKPHEIYKIYMITEADKMTTEAQNALLKTLENPPEYAIIVLITSNKEALLDTIKSRCEILKFNPLSINDVSNYLINSNIDESEAKFIASFSRGSIEVALELVGSDEFKSLRRYIQDYINTIIDNDIVGILDIATLLEKHKANINEILDIMINYFRDVMILKEGLSEELLINIDKLTYIENLNKKITYYQVAKIIEIINTAKKNLNSNCNFNISLQVMALNIHEVIK